MHYEDRYYFTDGFDPQEVTVYAYCDDCEYEEEFETASWNPGDDDAEWFCPNCKTERTTRYDEPEHYDDDYDPREY